MQAERTRETTEERMRELNAEERLEALVADIKEIQSRAGVYAVANFELLKQQYPDGVRQQALETGSRRLRDPSVIPAPVTDENTDADPSEPSSQEQETRSERGTETDNEKAVRRTRRCGPQQDSRDLDRGRSRRPLRPFGS